MSIYANFGIVPNYNGNLQGWNINQFNQNTLPTINSMQFNAGLATYNSSNPQIAAVGKNLINNSISSSFNGSPSSVTLTTPGGNGGNTFSKIGGWQAIGSASDAISGLFAGDKAGYQGEYGDLQQAGDKAFDAASDAVMAINPLVGGIMKAGGLVSDVLTAYGGMGTDSMTKTDAILGSKLLSLTPFGMINGWGGSKTQEFNKDMQAFETVGSSYTGTEDTANEALSKAGKKYGLFSSRQKHKADQLISEAKRQQNIMSDIADEASDRFAIRDSMAAINGNRRRYYLQGSYNQANVRVGKSGMSLELIAKAKKILGETRQLKSGGKVTPTEILLVVPEFQDGGQINKKSRTLQELIEYAKKKNPRFIQRMSEPLKYVEWIDKDGKTTHGTHELTYSEDDNGYFIFPMIQEDNKGNLVRYTNWREAYDNAFKNKNGLYVDTKDEAELFTVSGQNDDGTFYGYKAGWPEFFNQKPTKYKEGGSINIIPEGALHAHKHNMDMEGITPKGIPVVSNKEGGEVEQQAEIERSEVILRLEVTKTLEELMKKYYNENTSQKEKDEYALEAGKLLTQELIYNTIDNTGELL